MAKYVDAALGAVNGLTDVASGIAGIVYGAQQIQQNQIALEQNQQAIDIQAFNAQVAAASNLGSLALAANRVVNQVRQLEQVGLSGGQINQILMSGDQGTGNPNFVSPVNAGLNNFNRAYAADLQTRRYVANGQISALANGIAGARARPNQNRPDMVLGWDNMNYQPGSAWRAPSRGWSAYGSVRSISTLGGGSMSWDGYIGPHSSTGGSVRSLRSLSSRSSTSV